MFDLDGRRVYVVGNAEVQRGKPRDLGWSRTFGRIGFVPPLARDAASPDALLKSEPREPEPPSAPEDPDPWHPDRWRVGS